MPNDHDKSLGWSAANADRVWDDLLGADAPRRRFRLSSIWLAGGVSFIAASATGLVVLRGRTDPPVASPSQVQVDPGHGAAVSRTPGVVDLETARLRSIIERLERDLARAQIDAARGWREAVASTSTRAGQPDDGRVGATSNEPASKQALVATERERNAAEGPVVATQAQALEADRASPSDSPPAVATLRGEFDQQTGSLEASGSDAAALATRLAAAEERRRAAEERMGEVEAALQQARSELSAETSAAAALRADILAEKKAVADAVRSRQMAQEQVAARTRELDEERARRREVTAAADALRERVMAKESRLAAERSAAETMRAEISSRDAAYGQLERQLDTAVRSLADAERSRTELQTAIAKANEERARERAAGEALIAAAEKRVQMLDETLGGERDATRALQARLAEAAEALAAAERRAGAVQEAMARVASLSVDLSSSDARVAALERDLMNAQTNAASTGTRDSSGSRGLTVDDASSPFRKSLGFPAAFLPKNPRLAFAATPTHPLAPGTLWNLIGSPIAQDPPARAPPGAPPAVPGPSVAVASSAMSGQALDKVIARAAQLSAQGNIGAARLLYEHAMNGGSAEAIFRLAGTYDPALLVERSEYGVTGDRDVALKLYRRALEAGITEAGARIEALK